MLDLAKFSLFVQLAELGSLTRAAVILGLEPSAISRQISVLETECGGRLFHRTGRGVTLTELGERILPRAQRLLLEAKELQDEIKTTAGVPWGEVRFGMLTAAADPLLSHLLKKLRSNYPGIKLHVMEGSSGQIDQWMVTGRVDIGFVVREGHSASALEWPLATNRIHLLGAAGDPLTGTGRVDFTRLDKLPLILPSLPNGMRIAIEQLAKRKKITLNVIAQIDSLTIQKRLVAAGNGYTLASKGTFRPQQEGLSSAELTNPSLERTVMLTATTQRPLTLAARTIIDLVLKITKEIEGTDIWNGAISNKHRSRK